MDFLKKHYEKILLGVVLLGLTVAVAFLPFMIASERQKLNDMSTSVINPNVKPLTNLDLSLPQEALQRMATPAVIDFSEPNKLFNPRPWQKKPDGTLIPQDKVGPVAATVTNITPLYLRLSLDSVSPSDAGTKYLIGVEKQTAPTPSQRIRKETLCALNDKNPTFQLIEVKGKPEDPSQLVVILTDTGEKAIITKDKPYERVDGYMADLRYDLERKFWPGCRAGVPPRTPLIFNGEEYNIVAINRNEVVLSAKSNQKKWTIKSIQNTTP